MPSTREIRRRIRSVTNTAQITKAMEMVSAVKMRRAQAAVIASRPYAEKMAELLASLAANNSGLGHPLLGVRPIKRIGLVLITSDRGLCGALNINVIRTAAAYSLEQSTPAGLVTIGRRGRDWMSRRGVEIVADLPTLPDRPALLDIAPAARVVMDGYASGAFDAVYLVYSDFRSTTSQVARRKQLLPVELARGTSQQLADYIFEPSADAVLNDLLPRFVESEIYEAVLESRASEHSARMIAMHNATANAEDVVEDLTLSYNKARQAGITREILEIASGAEALSQG